MSMTQAAAATYLGGQLGVIATAVGSASYADDIAQALRRLGVSEADLATAVIADADRGAFLALAEYYALRRFARMLVAKANVSIDGLGSAQYAQMFDNVKELMGEAAASAAGLGYPVDAVPAWGLGSINLDFIEPEVTGL